MKFSHFPCSSKSYINIVVPRTSEYRIKNQLLNLFELYKDEVRNLTQPQVKPIGLLLNPDCYAIAYINLYKFEFAQSTKHFLCISNSFDLYGRI